MNTIKQLELKLDALNRQLIVATDKMAKLQQKLKKKEAETADLILENELLKRERRKEGKDAAK